MSPHRFQTFRNRPAAFRRVRMLLGLLPLAGPSVSLATEPVVANTHQFLLLDYTGSWTGTRQFRSELASHPTRWDQPVDFAHGTLHVRLEIVKKPSNIEVTSMLCLWQGSDESCTRRGQPPFLRFSYPGIYYATYACPGEGSDSAGNDRWSQADGTRFFRGGLTVDCVQLQWWAHDDGGAWRVLREKGDDPADVQEDFGPAVSVHLPIAYRIEIYVVAAGALFEAPCHWTAP